MEDKITTHTRRELFFWERGNQCIIIFAAIGAVLSTAFFSWINPLFDEPHYIIFFLGAFLAEFAPAALILRLTQRKFPAKITLGGSIAFIVMAIVFVAILLVTKRVTL